MALDLKLINHYLIDQLNRVSQHSSGPVPLPFAMETRSVCCSAKTVWKEQDHWVKMFLSKYLSKDMFTARRVYYCY